MKNDILQLLRGSRRRLGVGARVKRGWEVYERRERKGRQVGVLKRVGNRGKRGEHDYATILKISQTTRAKSRLREGSQG